MIGLGVGGVMSQETAKALAAGDLQQLQKIPTLELTDEQKKQQTIDYLCECIARGGPPHMYRLAGGSINGMLEEEIRAAREHYTRRLKEYL